MRTLDRWIVGRRGALVCAAIALISGLSGLFALPALDRNESAFVQATVQMLESGDFVAIRYQDYWRGGASPGAHWLQAAATQLLSSPEARAIWPYRLVSLFATALAAAATFWGASALFGRKAGFIAGVGLSVTLLVMLAAGEATADAPFLAAAALMLSGFGRVYLAAREGRRPRRRDRVVFWAGLIAGVLIKGPFALLLAALAGASLFAADRRADWFKSLGWSWGLLALAAFAGPWAIAITIASDGSYWGSLARLPRPHSPLLWQTWLAPLFLFPLTALLPAAAVHAFKARREPGVRVALAWLIPGWVLVQFLPNQQIFGALPLYIAIAWLGAAGVMSQGAQGAARRLGAGLAVLVGLGCAGLSVWVSARFGGALDIAFGLAAAVFFVLAGLAAALAVLRPSSSRALSGAALMAVLAPAWVLSVALPGLDRLWPTRRIIGVLQATGLDPRQGLAVGPVAAAGYQEPSLIFALGASTETGDGSVAARAIADGRPAIVEAAEEAMFKRTLASLRVTAEPIGLIETYDYAGAREIRVTVYRRASSE